MKKILITLLAFSSITFSAVAQDSTHFKHNQWQHKEGHEHFMGMKALNLTPDQKTQLKAYNESYHQQLQQLNQNENITVKEYRGQLYAINQEHKEKIKSILTEEQKAKLQKMKEDRMAQHNIMSAKRLDKMKANLGLTDEQVVQIKAQHDAVHEKIKSVMQNDSLTREQKQEQMMSIKNESREGFKKILTPDQLSKLKQLREARMEKTAS